MSKWDNPEYRREYDRKRYQSNKNKRIAQACARRDILRAWFMDLKAELSCSCGEDHPACIEFHHRDPTIKNGNVSDGVRLGWSRKRILREIAKCDVMCSNCHRKLHYTH